MSSRVMSLPVASSPRRHWHSLWGAAFTVGGLTATAKIAAMFKDSLVAARFGNGAELDAFLLSLIVPGFMISVAAGTLPAALTPTYIAVREHEGSGEARMVASAVLASLFRWLPLLAVGAAIASLSYGALPHSRLAPATRELLPMLALWLAPFTMLQGMCAAWSGLLAAERAYASSAIAPIAQPVGVTVALLVGGSTSVGVLVTGLLAGTFVQALVLALALYHRGLPIIAWRAPVAMTAKSQEALLRVKAQYVPAVAAAVLMSSTLLVDQTMATWLPSGSVSALGFGTKLSAVMMSVGAVALSTTLLPHLSELVAREEWRAVRALERRVGIVILATTIPLAASLIFLAEPIVRVLFERGAFTASETATVARVQSAYLLQLPVHLLGILYVRIISALQANRLLTVGSAINVVVNIALNAVFMQWIGVAGIALATAAVYTVSCVFLALAARGVLRAAERASVVRAAAVNATHREEPCASAA